MDEFLFLPVIAGAFFWLWSRQDRLAERINRLKGSIEVLEQELLAQERRQGGEAVSPPDPEPKLEVTPEIVSEEAMAFTSQEDFAEPEVEETAEEQFSTYEAPSKFDFEDIFGRLLPIWGGGIALAIAGFSLVRWSIENGILNEYVRVGLGFTFGIVLVAAAEIAHRFEHLIADIRVRQALAGAGIATLYASLYLAGSFYGLIGAAPAFGGLALVTGLAIFLSYRFGLPCAILGLMGGFAAPVLAPASDPNLPVLATYLAVVTGGLAYTGRKQGQQWLSLAALGSALGRAHAPYRPKQ